MLFIIEHDYNLEDRIFVETLEEAHNIAHALKAHYKEERIDVFHYDFNERTLVKDLVLQ